MSKYLVWFPTIPKKCKSFTNLKSARIFCNKQKIEACINIFPNSDNEDTIFSNKKGVYNA